MRFPCPLRGCAKSSSSTTYRRGALLRGPNGLPGLGRLVRARPVLIWGRTMTRGSCGAAPVFCFSRARGWTRASAEIRGASERLSGFPLSVLRLSNWHLFNSRKGVIRCEYEQLPPPWWSQRLFLPLEAPRPQLAGKQAIDRPAVPVAPRRYGYMSYGYSSPGYYGGYYGGVGIRRVGYRGVGLRRDYGYRGVGVGRVGVGRVGVGRIGRGR